MYHSGHVGGLGAESGRFPRSPASFPAGRTAGGGVSVREKERTYVQQYRLFVMCARGGMRAALLAVKGRFMHQVNSAIRRSHPDIYGAIECGRVVPCSVTCGWLQRPAVIFEFGVTICAPCQ